MSEGVKNPLEGKVCVYSDSHVAARTGNLYAGLELSAKTILTDNPALITLLDISWHFLYYPGKHCSEEKER